jgi:two-component system, sensor histidine kinase YesM
LNTTGWFVLGELPSKLLSMDSQNKQNIISVLVFINIVIPAVLIVILINKVLGPINIIVKAMRNVADGDLDTHIRVLTGNEIQRLSEGFNLMVSKLKTLMDENFEEGLRRKEAELDALQAQINPHFLYNTLESINWGAMMLTNGPNKVSDMVTALSDLLRLSINKGKEIVTIEEEVNHVKSYLLIQQERYNEKFDVEWQIDENVYKYKTIKLILQPLVENAIYHGLETCAGKGIIKIMGKIVENSIKIVITDNGIGMSTEILDNIQRSLENNALKENNNRSIGLKNVNDRIQLYFGKKYGLKVFSEEGKGTTIEIYLPLYEDIEL